MGILDYIRNLFKSNKKIARIITQDLIKTKGETEPLEVGLYEKQTPLTGKTLIIQINGVGYNRKTNEDGIAKLNINLPVGEYDTHISFEDQDYEYTSTYCKVTVNPVVITQNLDMVEKDGSKFKAYIQSSDGDNLGNVKVIFSINGVDYSRTTDANGLAALNINLKAGDYEIKTICAGVSCTNSIHISPAPEPEPKPEPTPEPTQLYDYITEQGSGKLGQATPYSCGPHSLMQCIYRLTGIELSESTLMGVCGCTTSGTSHQGLETGLAWFNRKYGYDLKMTWKNKSELSWDEIQSYIDNGALLTHILYRDSDGHYEIPLVVNTNPMRILNSLGERCGNGYWGYIESRSRASEESYINGISQKSICIITR